MVVAPTLPIQRPQWIGGGIYADVYSGLLARKVVVIKVARSEPRSIDGVTNGIYCAQGLGFATGSTVTWSPDPNEILEAERTVLAKIRHPAFVRLLDHGQTPEGRRYLVLEHIGGRTFRTAIGSEGSRLFPRIADVARALGEMRASGQLDHHGDIKPENLMLDAEGRVRILDPSSGLTKVQGGLISQLFQTDWYNPDFALSDVPALGLLLAEAATGRQLIVTASEDRPRRRLGPRLEDRIRLREMTGGSRFVRRFPHLPLPSELDAKLPSSLDAIVLRCLGLVWKNDTLDAIEPYDGPSAVAKAIAGLPKVG